MMQVGRYQHFKGGYYRLVAIATHSETGEQFVLYWPEQGEHVGQFMVRPVGMWEDHVERDGYSGPRFVLVE
jgi:hypothetical protein